MDNKSYSKGICWIDDCRIPFVDDSENTIRKQYDNKVQVGMMAERPNIKYVGSFDDSAKQGRFPANILVCDDMLNNGIKPNKGHRAKSKVSGYGEFGGGKSEYHGIGEYMSVDSTSRYYDIDKWFENLIDG